MTGVYVGIYGHTRCVDCGKPWSDHQQPGDKCPPLTTPAAIRRFWETFGTRPVNTTERACPCAQCRHN